MRVSDVNTEFLDKGATQVLIDELKAYIDGVSTGEVDLSSYVTKQELQDKLDALQIDVDLSAYATKEELETAINSIDLSAYATKVEIPSLEGYATTEYVDNKVTSIPATDLSNYYTKDETYSKTEVDTLVANSGGSSSGGSSGSGEIYSTDETAIGTWINGQTIYRKVISMDLPAVSSGNYHSAVTVVPSPCNIMMLDWRAVSYAGKIGTAYEYPSTIIHGDGFRSAVVWTTKTSVSSLNQELDKDMFSVFHAGNPTSSYINCYYGSYFASKRCDFILDYIKIESA